MTSVGAMTSQGVAQQYGGALWWGRVATLLEMREQTKVLVRPEPRSVPKLRATLKGSEVTTQLNWSVRFWCG